MNTTEKKLSWIDRHPQFSVTVTIFVALSFWGSFGLFFTWIIAAPVGALFMCATTKWSDRHQRDPWILALAASLGIFIGGFFINLVAFVHFGGFPWFVTLPIGLFANSVLFLLGAGAYDFIQWLRKMSHSTHVVVC
ncbi:MAG: hypothetical protein V1846_02105 [Candidatus Komeilibacteria bacterium]